MKKNIQIINMLPRGYCNGVIKAIRMINEVLKNNKYTPPLYMYGQLVHNSHVTNAFINKGIITINDYSNINEGTLIITAHGLSFKEKQFLLNKGINIIDTTCKEVAKIQNIVKQKISEGYQVFYYGKLNHPECKAVLNDNWNITLITNENDIDNISINVDAKIFFTNQTTMSYFDTLKIIEKIKTKYMNVEVNIDICTASKKRQEAVFNNALNCDIVLVIGDKKSNNTNKLKEICDNLNVKNYLIENIEDLKNINYTDVTKVGITAGSSTPNKLINEVINYLQHDDYVSTLTDNDYIDF